MNTFYYQLPSGMSTIKDFTIDSSWSYSLVGLKKQNSKDFMPDVYVRK
jgi:hypothetical protein